MIRWPVIAVFIALWMLVPVTAFGIAAFFTPWLGGAAGGTGEGLMAAFIGGGLARRLEPFIYLAGIALFLYVMLALHSDALQRQLAYYDVRPTLPAALGSGQPGCLQLTPVGGSASALVTREEAPGPRTAAELMELATQVLDQGWRHAGEVRRTLARVELTPDTFAVLYHLMLGQRQDVVALARQCGFDLEELSGLLERLAAQERVAVGQELCRLTPEGRRTLRRAAEELADALEGETLTRVWERARA